MCSNADSTKNTGKEYEQFVGLLQQAILNSDEYCRTKNIAVEVNKKIVDRSGIERQFDIYWEYELGGITYKTVIECKDYNSSISIEKIDALLGKLQDLPDLRGVFATKIGYQSGAKTKADTHKIDLLIVREQNDSDWEDKDGTPYIKIIDTTINIISPAIITGFDIFLDKSWIEKNTDIILKEKTVLTAKEDEVFVEDEDSGERYSLFDLKYKLEPQNENDVDFQIEKKFENAFILHPDLSDKRLKLFSYKLRYRIPKPFQMKMKIDFSKELVGVIEYLNKGNKKIVYKDDKIFDHEI